MSIHRNVQFMLLAFVLLLSGGCAGLQRSEPVDVIMAGIEPIRGEGLELRMLVKLRIQNPNDSPLNFNGVSVQMDVQGKRFATGVSDAAGSIPRFGETIVNVPVSISMLSVARQAVDVMTNEYSGKIAYEMTGRLAGPTFDIMRFQSKGEFKLPAELTESGR
jgi:LEA14-like dessication related protein